jgi:hypothetical protein
LGLRVGVPGGELTCWVRLGRVLAAYLEGDLGAAAGRDTERCVLHVSPSFIAIFSCV